jgi:hydrogenase nickel incorporation protein HypA/HybF
MHELALVESLIEQVGNEVAQSGHRGRVLGLELIVGRMSGANADSIRFAFELLAPGTLVEKAELRVVEPKAVCCCDDCGHLHEIDELAAACPQCGGEQISFQGGQDLLLQSIELED